MTFSKVLALASLTLIAGAALTACGYIASFFDAEPARAHLAEAIGLARELGDKWRLTQILAAQAFAAAAAGNPLASRAAAEEGRDLADAIGDPFDACRCRMYLGRALLYQGDLAAAAAQFVAVADRAEFAETAVMAASTAAQTIAIAAVDSGALVSFEEQSIIWVH